MIKAVIFDMDGLMIDSEKVTYECYVKVLEEMSLTMTVEFYKTLLGRTISAATILMKNQYGEDFPVQEVVDKVHILMNERFENEGIPVKKGLLNLLKYLKEHNYKTIVATSSHRHRVDKILTQANIYQYFDDSICGDEVENGKPNPEVFLKSCQKLGVSPQEALVLEDSEAGIQAAFSGHIPVICVPDMKYPESQFEEMTTKVYSSLDDVIMYLKEQNFSA